MKKMIFSFATCLALAGASTAALGQLGGFPKLPRGTSGSAVSSQDVDAYLNRSTETAKMMMSSVIILDYAQSMKTAPGGSAALKAKLSAINSKKDTKELNAYKVEIDSETRALNANTASAEDIADNYATASGQDKQLISYAVFNMMVAAPRAAKLAQDGPDLISGLGSSPANLGKIGKIKDAVELFGYQAKATSSFVGKLPKLAKAVKVETPRDPEAAEFKEFNSL